MIITHYFPCSIQGKIEHSITEYNPQQRFDIAKELAKCDGRALRRFDNFEEYIHRRIQTEEWLYTMAIKIGINPSIRNPIYFVLGENEKLKADFGSNSSYIQLDTDLIFKCHISFTIGDSMSVLFSKSPKNLYTTNQIKNLASDNDFINYQLKYIKPEHRYIEAQLWDKRYLQDHDNLQLSILCQLYYTTIFGKFHHLLPKSAFCTKSCVPPCTI